MFRTTFLRPLAIAAALTAGSAGCADVTDVAEVPVDGPQIAEKIAPALFIESGLQLLSHVSLVESTFGELLGIDIWGGSDYARLSQDTIDDIADTVGQRVEQSLFDRDRASATTIFRAESEYAVPDCFADGVCRDSVVERVTDRWSSADGLVWQANWLVDQMMKPENGHRRLQVAQHVQRLGSTAIFGYYQLAAAARVGDQGQGLVVQELRNAGDRAREILAHLDELADEVYPAYVESQFTPISLRYFTHGGRGKVEGCFSGPHQDEAVCIRRTASYGRDRTEREVRAELQTHRERAVRDVRSWWFPGVFGQDYFTVRYQLERIAGETEHLRGGAEPVDAEDCAGNDLQAGRAMIRGEVRTSCNGDFTLGVRADGDLVVTGPRGGVVWQAGTAGTTGFFLYLYGNGYLALLDSGFRPVWRVRDAEHVGDTARLVMRNNGELMIVDGLGYMHWTTGAPDAEPEVEPVTYGARVALRGFHSRYFVAEHDGSANANRGRVGSLERFNILNRHAWADGATVNYGDTIALQGGQHRFLVAEHNGDLNANRGRVGSLERFQVVDPRGRAAGPVPCGATIALRGGQGRYVVANADGTADADGRDPTGNAQIQIVCQ